MSVERRLLDKSCCIADLLDTDRGLAFLPAYPEKITMGLL